MTWIVGGNCFNGFVCVSDIQLTLEYSDPSKNKYFNCLKKVHQVHKNLCVAFSGHVKTGLILVENLREWLHDCIKEGTYFDLDGYSKTVMDFLMASYSAINGSKKPYVELMFLWTAQVESEPVFKAFCVKFKLPEFVFFSTPVSELAQAGSGTKSLHYREITNYLSGKKSSSDIYKDIFRDVSTPKLITVEKFKKNTIQRGVTKQSSRGKQITDIL